MKTYHQFLVDIKCKVCIFKPGLSRKSVLIQPINNMTVITSTSKAVLWCMNMGVNQSWHDKLPLLIQTYEIMCKKLELIICKL